MTTSTRNAAEVFAIVDSLDVPSFAQLFTETGKLVFANCEPFIGRAQIAEGTSAFFATIAGMHHTIVNEWQVEDTTIIELQVTYDRLDGKTADIPVVSIWHRTPEGLIDDYRVYFDLAPVFA
ncbi:MULTISPECIES: nuclear transport factor 2 family protein [Rhodococcus]|uniref:SnoaL-like domain-containing protein n=1 Tax=Rhodococcus opacus TaxID=37919 RepID=A0A076F5R6_RHOOP|nr:MULTISPECIES: nuclear transport factor 2 family protein [Rhodococcus]AII11019.1 hypothetical protein EP51_43815 [Rhodococcus opacus]OUS80903.1 hypothetical protein CA951_41855 [Rhodococcus sp. NCIMB 12038]